MFCLCVYYHIYQIIFTNKNAFQSKAHYPLADDPDFINSLDTEHQVKLMSKQHFLLCDLDPVTTIFKLDLDMVNKYLHTKMKFLGLALQKLQPEHTHTHTHTNKHTNKHTQTIRKHFLPLYMREVNRLHIVVRESLTDLEIA